MVYRVIQERIRSVGALSASLWAEIFRSAGVPDGVFNLVNGIGEEAGDALVQHSDVPLISFTGESATGQLIYRNCTTWR